MRELDAAAWTRRAAFLRTVRDFFHGAGFLEIDTPHLADIPGLEPHLDPYAVATERGRGWLVTSPEFALKRALGSGLPRIYEIAHAWRSGERGPWHAREFLMLEWYEAATPLEALMDRAEALLARVLGRPCPVTRLSMDAWFRRQLGHGVTRPELERALAAQGVAGAAGLAYEDLFFRRFLPTESALAGLGAVILSDYPAETACYARVAGGVARRFELYLDGVELANAFEEETRPAVLLERCRAMQAERRQLGKEPFPEDPHFLRALERVPGPVSGIALGLDRLFALAEGRDGLAGCCPYDPGLPGEG